MALSEARPPPDCRVPLGFDPSSRVGLGGAAAQGRIAAMGTRLLKVTVVLLCCINTAMWELYTESTMMALLWGATALAFVIWIVDDVRRG
jgi:hypothetical protein